MGCACHVQTYVEFMGCVVCTGVWMCGGMWKAWMSEGSMVLELSSVEDSECQAEGLPHEDTGSHGWS